MRWLVVTAGLAVAAFVSARCVASVVRVGAGERVERTPAAQEVTRDETSLQPASMPAVSPEEHRELLSSESLPERETLTGGTVDPVLGASCVLHGRVLFEAAPFPIPASASVFASRESELRKCEVRADGAYSMAGLAPGLWHVEAQRLGYRKTEAEVELGLEEPVLRLDLTLSPAWLLRARIVTPGGEALVGALPAPGMTGTRRALVPKFVATREPPPESMPEARVNHGYVADGVYHDWDSLVAGAGEPVLEVLVEGPVYVSLVLGESVLATQLVERGAEVVTFVLDPEGTGDLTATVTLRLVSEVDGAPLTRGEVDIDGTSGDMFRGNEWQKTLPPGRYRLTFGSYGYASRRRTVVLAAGEELALGDIALAPETHIAGHLLDAEGRPVRGLIEVGRREGGRVSFSEEYAQDTDSDGRFDLHRLERGEYVLRSGQDHELSLPAGTEPPERWFLPSTTVSTLAGSVEGLELRAVRAGFLAVRDADAVAEGSLCKVMDARGELVAYGGFYPGRAPRLTLPPGPCTFVLCDAQWQEVRRFELVIGAGVTELELGQ